MVDIAAIVVVQVIYIYNLFEAKSNEARFMTMISFGTRPEEPFSVVFRFSILFAFKALVHCLVIFLIQRRLKKENLREKILDYVWEDFETWYLVYPIVMIVAIANGFTIYSNMLIFNDNAREELNLIYGFPIAKPRSFWQVQLQEFVLAQ
jgi:hypothetical protein